MSYYWLNTIWQSKTGSWNRGFWKRFPGDMTDPDYNEEWDAEFSDEEFDYLRTGIPNLEAAEDWTPAGNPGTWVTIPYSGNSKDCKALDQLAHWHRNPDEHRKAKRREMLKKNREHFKELQDKWPEASLNSTHRITTVTVKGDEEAHSRLGMTSVVTGFLELKGDWLEVKGSKVFNTKTKKFHNRVHAISRH